MNRKRKFNFEESKKKDKKIVKPRYLADIVIEPDWDSEKLGNVIADALFEQKPELIGKSCNNNYGVCFKSTKK